MCKGPLCWQRHPCSMEMDGAGKPGDRRTGEKGCMACTPVMSKRLGVQPLASWAAVSLALLPLASHSLGPWRPHPLPQSPQWLQESWSPRCPCHHAPDSLLPISGSIVPSELGSAHPPLLPGVTSKHYFPHPVLCLPKSFAGPHPAVFSEKSGVTVLDLRTPL